ncbi:MAG: YeeE/YedE family protein [Paracoccaceae bacterium]
MEQDWIMGLLGGLIIGTAGAVYLLSNGRVMGASGIIGGLVDGSGRSTAADRIAFLAGLMIAPALLWRVLGAPATNITSDVAVLLTAGLLVGVGTRIANGCTSGHGVCGISRLSPRGIIASVTYILAGAGMMFVFRHALGII